jgi:arylsulfatase
MGDPSRPNVVFLLADNLGYGDVGCYGAGEQRGMPTPNIDKLASEGVKLNQFMVEAACTPSRAALLTGRYSIRTGLSLLVVPGGSNELQPDEYTLGNVFKDCDYSTVYYGKWHLGESAQSDPQYFGFDEWRYGFYGSSDGTLSGDNMIRFHAPEALQEAGTIMVRESRSPNEPSEPLFPYDLDYRRRIDNEMTDDAIEYINEHAERDEPFFVFMGLTRPHFPNLPSDEFEGKSRIGGYGDCIMELDHNVGRIQEAIDNAGVAENTIFVFVSDNGPTVTATVPEEMHYASAGPWRGELGDAWEGSARTVGVVRWPGHIDSSTAEGMVSIMDFLPTFANILGVELPTDRPIDGIDQTDYLTGEKSGSNRAAVITFLGDRLAAVRWRQWRIYTMNTTLTDQNPSLGGYQGYRNETTGLPMAFNIEADPREMRNVMTQNSWVMRPYLQTVGEYTATLKKHPNPPPANLTIF